MVFEASEFLSPLGGSLKQKLADSKKVAGTS
jgi:hypothetical protein